MQGGGKVGYVVRRAVAVGDSVHALVDGFGSAAAGAEHVQPALARLTASRVEARSCSSLNAGTMIE